MNPDHNSKTIKMYGPIIFFSNLLIMGNRGSKT